MYNRPHFSEYVMARLITMAVVVFIIFSILLTIYIDDSDMLGIAILLIGLAFTVFVYAIHRGAKRMERELVTINKYMENLDQVDKIDYKARFFTQEFEDINHNLIKVLKSSKKREDVKQRYKTKPNLKTVSGEI